MYSRSKCNMDTLTKNPEDPVLLDPPGRLEHESNTLSLSHAGSAYQMNDSEFLSILVPNVLRGQVNVFSVSENVD